MNLSADSTPDRSSDLASAAKCADALRSRVERVAERALRAVRWRAVLLAFLTVAGVLLVAIACDAWWRTVQPWPRWILFAVVLAVAGAAIFWWLVPAFRLRLSPLEAARRIETSFPEWGDRLSSIIALNESTGPPQPERSEQLVQRGTVETFRRIESHDLSEALQRNRNHRLAALTIAFLGGFLLLFAIAPQGTSRALQRVAMPWAEIAWPRQHVLELQPLPQHIHAGTELTVTIRDRQGKLPDDLVVWMQNDSLEKPQPIPLNPPPADADADNRAIATATIPGTQVEGELAVRAVGGDDRSMPWHRIAVVSPPRLTSAVFRVTPPAYTGLPEFEASDPSVTIPAGSAVQFEARVDRPLQEAAWQSPAFAQATDFDSGSSPLPAEAALRLQEDGTAIRAQWQAGDSASTRRLRIVWVDHEGARGQSQQAWKLTVAPDRPPQVIWQNAPSLSQLSVAAVIPLRWRARDDFGIAASWLEIEVVGTTASEDGEEGATSEPHFRQNAPATDNDRLPRQLQRSESLDFASLERIEPGGTVRISAVAIDGLDQRGESSPLSFRIVNPEQLQSQLADAGKEILEQLRETRTQQQTALERTEEARARLGDTAEADEAAADMLRIAEAAQRAIARELEGGPQAAIDAAESLVAQADANRLEGDVVAAFREVLQRLETIRDEAVLPANASLQQAADRLQDAEPAGDAVDGSLRDAVAHQRQSSDQLQELVDRLASSLQVQSVAQSIRELADAQRRLAGSTVRSDQASSPEAERQRLAASQQSMARQAEQLQGELDQLASSDAQSAARRETFAQASERLRQQRTPQRMREAGEKLRQQRVGDAIEQQRAISEDLADVARRLQDSDAGSDETASRAAWLREASRIAERQSAIADAIERVVAAEGVRSDETVGDQQDHASRTQRFAETVDALPIFGAAARSAHRSMIAAAARLERDATDERAITESHQAAQRMREIAEALRAAAAQSPTSPSEEATQQNDQASQQAEQNAIPLESIYLIRTMQARLQAATQQLQQQQAAPLSDQEQRELQRRQQEIAAQQTDLLEQVEALMSATGAEND